MAITNLARPVYDWLCGLIGARLAYAWLSLFDALPMSRIGAGSVLPQPLRHVHGVSRVAVGSGPLPWSRPE